MAGAPAAPSKGAILKGFFVGAGAVYPLCLGWAMAQAFISGEYGLFNTGLFNTGPTPGQDRATGLVLWGILIAPVAVFGGVMVAVATYRGVSLRSALAYGAGGLVGGLLFGLAMYFVYPYAPRNGNKLIQEAWVFPTRCSST